MLAEVQTGFEAVTLRATFGYVKPEVEVDNLAENCRGVSRDCCLDTKEVKAMSSVHNKADPIPELKTKAFSETLGEAFYW